jgi:hypothetical protein
MFVVTAPDGGARRQQRLDRIAAHVCARASGAGAEHAAGELELRPLAAKV